ncbi:MAG: hypothetical protein HC877_21580 [Thioploca sp.]|nr:hypothetical protein [Thioploca sp.]
MNITQLTLEQTPPLSVPFRFFLTAPLFGILAALLLLGSGPTIFSSRWSLEVITLTHLLTLGFISMVIFGAFLQFLPVLVGSPVPYPRLVSTLLHLLLTIGSLSLTSGFMMTQVVLIEMALVLLGLSFIGFMSIIGYSLIRTKSNAATVTAMRLAWLALAITVVLGLILGTGFGYGYNLSSLAKLTNLHLGWGLLGWVGLLIIGVAYQVVPMFQITPPYPAMVKRWLTPLIFLTLLTWSGFYWLFNLNNFSWILFGLMDLIGIEFSLFALVTLQLQSWRLRKLPDVTLDYWRIGMIGLLLSFILGLAGLIWSDLSDTPIYQLQLGILFIAGFILPVIQGMLYKIVPFLIWLHWQNQQLNILTPVRLVKIPHMKQIIPDRWARYQLWVYFISLILLIIVALYPSKLIYGVSMSFMLAFALLTYNLYRSLWLYWSVSQQLIAKSMMENPIS